MITSERRKRWSGGGAGNSGAAEDWTQIDCDACQRSLRRRHDAPERQGCVPGPSDGITGWLEVSGDEMAGGIDGMTPTNVTLKRQQ